jgi:two-component system cell cycle sensor histidine kinase/response regulator CckA
VLEAGTGDEAEAVWRAERGGIDLLLTDVVFPGHVSGLELSRRFRAERPELAVVVMSGYSVELTEEADGELPVFFLSKPFTIPSMSSIVRRALDEPRAGSRRPV